ncbi:hypothetical protein AAFH68_19450 [Flavobacterium sp. CGRL1]
MRLVVLGGGESGVGTAILGKKKGYDVFVSDFGKIKESYKEVLIINKIDWEEEQHTEDLILNADVVMKSPGIPDKSPIIKKTGCHGSKSDFGNRICKTFYRSTNDRDYRK